MQVVIVTGAGSGIGEATAKRFLKEQAMVGVCDKDLKKLKKAFEDYPEDRTLISGADVSKESDVQEFVKQVVKKFGHIDILVNNAGVYFESKVEGLSLEIWRDLMSVNLDGVFLMARESLKHLKKTKGCIINISSVSGLGADPESAAYNASKGAVTNLTRALAIDYAKDGIRVNAVCPTLTRSDMTKEMLQDKKLVEGMLDRIPMGRIGEPEDIADAVWLLTRPEARFITGVNLPVDGGLSASNGQVL